MFQDNAIRLSGSSLTKIYAYRNNWVWAGQCSFAAKNIILFLMLLFVGGLDIYIYVFAASRSMSQGPCIFVGNLHCGIFARLDSDGPLIGRLFNFFFVFSQTKWNFSKNQQSNGPFLWQWYIDPSTLCILYLNLCVPLRLNVIEVNYGLASPLIWCWRNREAHLSFQSLSSLLSS